MGYALRNSNPEIYRFITMKTIQGKMYLRPTGRIRKMLGGILARYKKIHGVEIYAYAFLSNHYHLIVRAPAGNIDRFMEDVNREISRRMNYRLARSGCFWSRRYSDLEILSEEDLLEAVLYVATNMCRHGLVADAKDWTGLHCFEQLLSERKRSFSFHHYSAREHQPAVTHHTLELTVLPQFAGLSKKQRREKLRSLLLERQVEIASTRADNGEGFMGIERILQLESEAKPRRSSNKPSPPCYTKCFDLRQEYVKREKLRKEQYTHASLIFRAGHYHVDFPEHTFRPPPHHAPKEHELAQLPEIFNTAA